MFFKLLKSFFKISEDEKFPLYRFIKMAPSSFDLLIKFLGSRVSKEIFKLLIRAFLYVKPCIKPTGDRHINVFLEFFNSLSTKKKEALILRLIFHYNIGKFRRFARFLKTKDKEDVINLTSITLSIGGLCNLDCPGCFMKGLRSDKFIESDKIKYILDQTSNNDVFYVSIIGSGEPFLNVDSAIELFDCIKNYENMTFIIYSNGTTINESIAAKASELDNVIIFVSIDGFEKQNSQRMGVGAYKNIIKSFGLLKKYKIPFGYSTVVHTKNYKVVTSQAFIKEMAGHGNLVGLYNQFCTVRQSGCEHFFLDGVSTEEYKKRFKEVSQISPIYLYDLKEVEIALHGCKGKKGTICFIDGVTGKVSPCFLFPYAPSELNVYNDSSPERLSNILRSSFFKGYRKSYVKGIHCTADLKGELEYFYRNNLVPYEDGDKIKEIKTR